MRTCCRCSFAFALLMPVLLALSSHGASSQSTKTFKIVVPRPPRQRPRHSVAAHGGADRPRARAGRGG